MNQGTFSDYHLRPYTGKIWLFYGGDHGLNVSSMTGIFVDYERDADAGYRDRSFGSRLSLFSH